jgi:hypothetical protein
MNIIGDSIPEFLRNINSRLTFLDCASILLTMVFLGGITGYLYMEKIRSQIPVVYIENTSNTVATDNRPFGSKNGTTYTFSWCQGANVILPKNKIYFVNENEAQNSGRSLSKLCSPR